MAARARYSEDDVEHYDRPRRRTRPRTKERPTYDDAVDGVVTTVDRGRLRVLLTSVEAGANDRVTAVKARPLGRKGVVVGDRVRVVGDLSGEDGTLARVVEIGERSSVLRRTADDDDPYERVIVANAEQLVIVTALADPEPRTGLIDRALVAAFQAGMSPVLCLTKSDLASADDLIALYRPMAFPVVTTRRDQEPGALREVLAGRTSVLLGHSGVGKSTLVNALVPDAARETGDVNAVTGRGRHTSTSAILMPMPGMNGSEPGWVIDTPGIRSFGLAHVEPADLLGAFPDLADALTHCPRGCTHETGAPGCGLDGDDVSADPGRVESFRRLVEATRS